MLRRSEEGESEEIDVDDAEEAKSDMKAILRWKQRQQPSDKSNESREMEGSSNEIEEAIDFSTRKRDEDDNGTKDLSNDQQDNDRLSPTSETSSPEETLTDSEAALSQHQVLLREITNKTHLSSKRLGDNKDRRCDLCQVKGPCPLEMPADDNGESNDELKAFCSERCFSRYRRAAFKRQQGVFTEPQMTNEVTTSPTTSTTTSTTSIKGSTRGPRRCWPSSRRQRSHASNEVNESDVKISQEEPPRKMLRLKVRPSQPPAPTSCSSSRGRGSGRSGASSAPKVGPMAEEALLGMPRPGQTMMPQLFLQPNVMMPHLAHIMAGLLPGIDAFQSRAAATTIATSTTSASTSATTTATSTSTSTTSTSSTASSSATTATSTGPSAPSVPPGTLWLPFPMFVPVPIPVPVPMPVSASAKDEEEVDNKSKLVRECGTLDQQSK